MNDSEYTRQEVVEILGGVFPKLDVQRIRVALAVPSNALGEPPATEQEILSYALLVSLHFEQHLPPEEARSFRESVAWSKMQGEWIVLRKQGCGELVREEDAALQELNWTDLDAVDYQAVGFSDADLPRAKLEAGDGPIVLHAGEIERNVRSQIARRKESPRARHPFPDGPRCRPHAASPD